MDTLNYVLNAYGAKNQDSPIVLYNSRRYSLTKLFRELGLVLGAEIGVARGHFSEILFQKVPNLKLYCIDAWQNYDQYNYVRSQEKMEKIFADAKQRLAPFKCQIIRDWSIAAVKRFEDKSLDFVYIDGAHDYKHAMEDIREWSRKVRKGGIVAGHDYISPEDILKKLPRYSSDDYNKTNYDVKSAVNDWVKENKIKNLFVFNKDLAPSWFYVKES